MDEERFTIIESFANDLRHTQHSTAPIKNWADGICLYYDRSSTKNLRNPKSFVQHPEEPNWDPGGTRIHD
jgi:hypothetical protein